MIPPVPHPDCSSAGERKMFQRLRDDPGTRDWTVMHSLALADHPKQIAGEIDFVVIVPGGGTLCLEIKACYKLSRKDGDWYYGDDPVPSHRSPFEQASSATHALRGQVSRAIPSLRAVPFWHAVVFTHMSFDESSSEWHEWEVIDAVALGKAPVSELIWRVLRKTREHISRSPTGGWLDLEDPRPSERNCEHLVDFLRPDFEIPPAPEDRAELHKAELRRFTASQFRALDAMEMNDRVVFVGPAGCGKTLLAQEETRRATLRGQRTLLVCFNRLLGDWLEKSTALMAPSATVANIHRLMLGIAGCEVVDEPGFWQHDLPWAAISKLWEMGDGAPVFDELVVDESQDLIRDQYADFLDVILEGGLSAGRWRMFGDFERQSIYSSSNLSLDEFLESRGSAAPLFSLRDNCRNTPRVADLAEALSGLRPSFAQVLRPDDNVSPKVVYYENQEHQIEMVSDYLDGELKGGTRPQDIAVLSAKSDKRSAASALRNRSRSNLLAPAQSATENSIRFCSIHAFKGLEAPVVIVTDIEEVIGDEARSLLYVALTRSTGRLVVFADAKAKADVISTVLERTEESKREAAVHAP